MLDLQYNGPRSNSSGRDSDIIFNIENNIFTFIEAISKNITELKNDFAGDKVFITKELLIKTQNNIAVAKKNLDRLKTLKQDYIKKKIEELKAQYDTSELSKIDKDLKAQATTIKKILDKFDKQKPEPKKKAVTKKAVSNDVLTGTVIVFSGFRDSELEDKIKTKGGVVGKTITGKTTHLIVKNIDKTTAKIEQAKANGVIIVSLEQFSAQYGF